jgi:hypothetical protein
MDSPLVFKLEQGKSYVVFVSTGMLPYQKAQNYIQNMRELVHIFESTGCKLYFSMYNKLIYSIKELEDKLIPLTEGSY